jgi:hypothetical protein
MIQGRAILNIRCYDDSKTKVVELSIDTQILLIKILKGPKWGLGEHGTSKYKKKQGCQRYEPWSVYWLNSYETN